ncbi:hypothetical protein D3C80_1251080 [compost metagenome]
MKIFCHYEIVRNDTAAEIHRHNRHQKENPPADQLGLRDPVSERTGEQNGCCCAENRPGKSNAKGTQHVFVLEHNLVVVYREYPRPKGNASPRSIRRIIERGNQDIIERIQGDQAQGEHQDNINNVKSPAAQTSRMG